MYTWYPEADTVILHGTIYTVAITCDEVKQGKSDFPIIRDGGIAIKDGTIIAVGSADEMRRYQGEHTTVMDATGKVVAPGFCDSHIHVTFYGNGLLELDLGGIEHRAEVFEKVAAYAKKLAPGKWVLGNSWNHLAWDDKTLITCDELDAVTSGHPAFLMGTTYHTAFANSEALRLAGITAQTPDPEGGTIGRFPDGRPNGVLYENSAMDLVQRVIPEKSDDDRVEALVVAGDALASMGITSAIDANMSDDQVRAYGLAYQRHALKFRANLMYYLDSARGDAAFHLRRLEEAEYVTGFGNPFVKINAIKVTLDGVPSMFTAAMRRPYKLDPTTTGPSIWTQDEITAFVCKANEKNWQFGIHVTGDRAADMAIEAFEAADRQKPIADKRDYLIHYVLPQEDQWDRMKKLNINVTMQPTIASTLGEAPGLYDDQARVNQGAGLMFKNGIICGGSSDCPVVTPNPLTGMYYAVTRLDETSGNVLGEECKVTPEQALIMWTKNSAYFSHDDDHMGSVEVGNYADLVIVDREFLTGNPEDIRDAQVEKTILAGKVVYEKK